MPETSLRHKMQVVATGVELGKAKRALEGVNGQYARACIDMLGADDVKRQRVNIYGERALVLYQTADALAFRYRDAVRLFAPEAVHEPTLSDYVERCMTAVGDLKETAIALGDAARDALSWYGEDASVLVRCAQDIADACDEAGGYMERAARR